MTSVEIYQSNLRMLVAEHKVKDILEIGVEKGVSTEVFCNARCRVLGVDIQDLGYRHENLTFRKADASTFIKNLGGEFDMVYLDAFYTYERLEHDVPLCWNLLKEGGILVFNEYIDFADHRKGEVRKFVHDWAFKNSIPFMAYPLRNGQAVFVKGDELQ